jgi:hypothetical protein
MKLKKILLWTLVAFFLYAIYKSPSQAANIVQSAWDIIVQAFASIGSFFSDLLNRN